MRLPNFVIRWFKKKIDQGHANCLIYALYMQQVYKWKMVFQPTTHNKWAWLVWWHVKVKPPECPITGNDCAGEEAFEPDDYKVVILPPPLFKGSVKKQSEKE